MSESKTPNYGAVPKIYKKQIKQLNKEAEEIILEKRFNEAQVVIQQIKQLSNQFNYTLGKAMSFNQEGNLYETEERFSEAIRAYLKGMNWLENRLDCFEERELFFKMKLRVGVLHFFEQRYEDSLEFLFSIITTFSEQETLSDEEKMTLCNTHFSAALVYNQNKYEAIAITHLNKTIELAEELADDEILGRSYNALAMTKLSNNEIAAAKGYFEQAIFYKKKTKDKKGAAVVYLNMSRLYEKMEDYETALTYVDQALDYESTGLAYDKLLIGTIRQQAGRIHFKLKEYELALGELELATVFLIEIKNLKVLNEVYQLYCDIYVATQNFEWAYYYSVKLNEINQQIIEKEKQKSLTELQIKYETEQKKKEAELYKLKSKALERSNESLEQFAHVVAHDLKNPLRSVMGYISLLKRKFENQLDENGLEYIDLAKDSGKQMEQLINDLLAFAKVKYRTEENFESIDLIDVVAESVRGLAHFFNENTNVFTNILPTVRADESQIFQLFQNIIANALKYNNAVNKEVTIKATTQGSLVEIAIADNGIGIPEAEREKVFDILYRLHKKKEAQGTGIGLSICKKIVEYHGGRLWIETGEGGQGSVFKFTLKQ